MYSGFPLINSPPSDNQWITQTWLQESFYPSAHFVLTYAAIIFNGNNGRRGLSNTPFAHQILVIVVDIRHIPQSTPLLKSSIQYLVPNRPRFFIRLVGHYHYQSFVWR